MVTERSLNAKRNSIWGLLSRIISLILPFITRTIIIRILGAEYLGLSGLFTSILSVLNLTELGFGSAIVFSMYKPIANGDTELVCALLNLYKKMYRIIGGCIFAIGLCILPFVKMLIHGSFPNDINIYILYLIYVANATLSYFLFAYKRSILHACQRDDILSKVLMITTLVLNILQIAVLFIVKNYYLFVIIQIITTILSNFIVSYFAYKFFPQYICKGQITVEQKIDIKKRVTGLMVIKLAAVSRNALDSIIVSLYLGLQAVAIYNNYFYIINAISSLMIVLTSAISAGIGNCVAIESREKNLEIMKNINFLYMLLAGIVCSCIVTMYQPFMKLWVGEELMFSTSIMFLFSIYFVLMKVGDVQAQFFDAAGLWWYGRWRGFIEAIFNLILNTLLGYFLGVFGIVLATIITMLTINFPLSIYFMFKYYFIDGMKEFALEQIQIVIKIFLVAGCCYIITQYIPTANDIIQRWILLILKGMVAASLFIALYVLVNIKNPRLVIATKWMKDKLLRR